MSGGGTKGAYEAGVLWGLINSAPDPSKYAWDVVTGVSIGAINAVGVSLWAPGDEAKMVPWLSEVWQELVSSDVYTNWKPAGPLTGLLEKSGLEDTSVGIEFMQGIFD